MIRDCLGSQTKLVPHGPSVSFYCDDGAGQIIKVDLCLILEAERREAESCLREAQSKLVLPYVKGHKWSDKCYVLCSREFWKITVCKYEREYLQHTG